MRESIHRELTKDEIAYMKREVVAHIELHGGAAAHVKWHRQQQYVEAFIAIPMSQWRNVMKVRYYRTGEFYTINAKGYTIEHWSHKQIGGDK